MTEDHQRAATGYLIWPLALVDIVREPPDASQWERIHARQAAMLGLAGTLAYLFVLAIPFFVVVAVPGISPTAVVGVYVVGLLADLVAAVYLFGVALHFSGRASRGELFAIPVITRMVDRVFPR